jgi:hypothetical protein
MKSAGIRDVPDLGGNNMIAGEKKKTKQKNNPEIVWLDDPLKFTYLRETILILTAPRHIKLKTPLFVYQEKIVGYEINTPRDSYGCYIRRVWWLKTYDRDIDPDGSYKYHWPHEAVVPSSISIERKSTSYAKFLLNEARKFQNWERYSNPASGLSGTPLLNSVFSDEVWITKMEKIRQMEKIRFGRK